jgi:hypothetical protein
MPQTKTTKKPAARASAQPKPELKLTDFQTFVCDRVADLLLRGGHEHDLDNLIYAAAGHHYRTVFPASRMHETAEQEQKRTTEFIESHIESWRARLMHEWPAPEDKKEPEPKGVLQKIFAGWNWELRNDVEEFMNEAGAVDKRLLHEVLEHWDSRRQLDPEHDAGATLANCFASEADNPNTYFRVPDRIRDLVEGYVALLLNGVDAKAKPDAA